ncbi:pilin, partial [Patescibacteria group bacterium]|nr:pilin [Patescibacteria group bacterium]
MKKIIFTLLLLLIFFPTIVFGAEACTWKTEVMQRVENMTTFEGGCSRNEVTKSYDNCDPDTKPEQTYGASRTVTPVCCCVTAAEAPTEKAKFTMPVPAIIDINALNLSEATCTGPENSGTCSIPWVAQLIQYLYTFGLGIGGILAAVVLMAGGLVWLVSAGDATKITQAKSLIVGSITGLMILFGSYILLTQINPNLVVLKPLSLKMIEQIVITADSEGTTAITLDMEGIAQAIGATCGTDTVADIINKSKGKVTYNNPNRGTVGPNNTVFNDCSGFSNFVLKCAQNKNTGNNTG